MCAIAEYSVTSAKFTGNPVPVLISRKKQFLFVEFIFKYCYQLNGRNGRKVIFYVLEFGSKNFGLNCELLFIKFSIAKIRRKTQTLYLTQIN